MTDPALRPTDLIDSDHPQVAGFAAEHGTGSDPREVAVALYYAVRDGFRYDPYRIDLSPDGMRASMVLANGYGWCVPKAALLAASCRSRGIPARVGYADVRNHLSTQRLRETMGTDVFLWHGYTDILLDGTWVKATPAFNRELCEAFGLHTLEFDGRSDSIYHPYDKAGNRHMEYVTQRGSFDDVPLERMRADFEVAYPTWSASSMARADWVADVAVENA
ncbi:MAG: transglutaminase family protein [Dermatophilaceae bacterium]